MDASGEIRLGDCLGILANIRVASADTVYLDPPFFTGKNHRSSTRDGLTHYSFSDCWGHSEEYLNFLAERLSACRKVMKESASIYVHGDHNNTHLARQALDLVFGPENFRSEIIWYYKRWSNAKRGLLQQHQTILHYSIGSGFKWNKIIGDYSATTNLDQILQKRARDRRGKSVYATDNEGKTVYASNKQGVPLGDVWEIPFLNPKAKERTGYPTQKPLLLLERILEISTDEGDLVVDPFCGSGTTLIAAKLLNRRYLGIDVSPEAVSLSEQRLKEPIKTESALMRDGIDSYRNDNEWVNAHLAGFAYSRVHRNLGLDAVLKNSIDGKAAFIRVQRENETLSQTIFAMKKALASKGETFGIVIATGQELFNITEPSVKILPSPALQLRSLMKPARTDKERTRRTPLRA